MNDKDLKKSIQKNLDPDLHFTKEDRENVFQKIKEEQITVKLGFIENFKQRAAPLMAMAVLISLSVILVYSLIGPGYNQQADQSEKDAAPGPGKYSSLLLLLKEEDNRTALHLLITFKENGGAANMMLLPGDTLVPSAEGTDVKLSSAYTYEQSGQTVLESVSQLLDIPIDYYAAVDSDDFEFILKTIGETELTVDESKDLSLTGDIELYKGENLLDGTEALSLLTAKENSEEGGWTYEDRLELSKAVLKNLLKNVPSDYLFKNAETNTEMEKVITDLSKTNLNEMDTSSLKDHLDSIETGEEENLILNKDYLEQIKREMTSF